MTTLKPSAEDDGKAQCYHLYNHKPLCEWRQITSTPVQPLEKEATDTLKVLVAPGGQSHCPKGQGQHPHRKHPQRGLQG